MLPPQRLAARPTQLMAPPQTRPRTAVTHEPIEIHGHSRNSATSKGDTIIHVDCADLQELAFKGEAYDPARPNDYMEFCKERENRAKDEERQREYEKFRKEREEEMRRGRNTLAGLQSLPSNGDNPMPDSIMPARGRGRGGVSNLPSWMTKGAPVEDKNRCVDTLSALESGKTQFADAQVSLECY
ncbi:hypothetical protein Naga_100023g19 [Nannochloropsis gaditana]|uniref:Uncharacterized protein n=1 Tax=Nannochloropsis gaditana TaxID=72520 RepID=W7TPG7_9STRA|nr:hypothetical protein Naga_100023g19 [Nannochloropsis gaditana]